MMGTKPIPEPMLIFDNQVYQLAPVKSESEFKISLRKMQLKMSSAQGQPLCSGLYIGKTTSLYWDGPLKTDLLLDTELSLANELPQWRKDAR